MRWRTGRRSSNVEDRRGGGAPRRGGFRLRGGIMGVVIAVGAIYMGADPKLVLSLLTGGGNSGPVSSAPYKATPEQEQLAEFTRVVLADTEDTWHALFKQQGKRYKEPVLVMFSNAVRSACGSAQSAMGPFYCPADQKVYIDLSFYAALKQRHNAPGDFAQAYVIAHEVGHHVQNLLGISNKVHAARQRSSKVQGNALSVRQELQADCFSGVWAHHAQRARNILEPGDIDEALNAASKIGDDTLQRQARGHVVPESFTHGSAAQRQRWFKVGYEQGTLSSCDTFSARSV